MQFPTIRLRRLRNKEGLRRMVRETRVTLDDLVMPLFVVPGNGIKQPITSLPGNYHWSPDKVAIEAKELFEMGIQAVLLFGLPESKDKLGSGAWAANGSVQVAIRAIKQAVPEMMVISDVCLCQYTEHGHCGIIEEGSGIVDNDATLPLLAKIALSHADAGVDMVAPSDMMDGRVKAIRSSFDAEGYTNLPIMSYAAKFASAFYGPFRDAAECAPQFGDRSSYQMEAGNAQEALREASFDLEEGADILMVKPALAYLDIIYRIKEKLQVPVAAYQVSGEYAMIKAAVEKGWLDEKRAILESVTAIKRAGADIIITYFARELAKWL